MATRTRPDRCPGALRPWIADDGALVRLRLIGGHLPRPALEALLSLAEDHGDGGVHLTRRANLQLRALPHEDGVLDAEVLARLRTSGLLPSLRHELVRNVVVSPLTGRRGGRADLRPLAAGLDAGLCADPVLAGLSARFLFVLDDGRGDVLDQRCDLGLVVLDDRACQLRVGRDWGDTVPLEHAPTALLALARAFVAARGSGPEAPWHVDELLGPLVPPAPPDPRLPDSAAPPPEGRLRQDDGRHALHVPVPDGVLTRSLDLPGTGPLVVTPWRSLVVPDLPADGR